MTHVSQEGLEPCPFCGGKNITLLEHTHDLRGEAFELEMFSLTCSPAINGCGAETAQYAEISDAKAAWNRRVAFPLLRLHEHKADKWCYYCKADTHNDAECWCTRPADWIAGGAPNRLILPAGVEHKADGGGREGHTVATEGVPVSVSLGCDAEAENLNRQDNEGSALSATSARLQPPSVASTRSGVIEEAIRACDAQRWEERGMLSGSRNHGIEDCVTALRALIPNPTKEALPEEPKPDWVWVPVEATEEMIMQGIRTHRYFDKSDEFHRIIARIWESMLSGVPKAQGHD